MKTKDILLSALTSALLIVLYIALLALVVPNIPNSIDHTPQVGMTLFLTLFVLSAATTGTLFLGRPVAWYIDGKRKEAWQHIGATICFLFLILIILGTVFTIFTPRAPCAPQDSREECRLVD